MGVIVAQKYTRKRRLKTNKYMNQKKTQVNTLASVLINNSKCRKLIQYYRFILGYFYYPCK